MLSIRLLYFLMKILFDCYCTLKSLSLPYYYYLSYYNIIMMLMLLHKSLFNYYFYYYIFCCSKHSVFIHEPVRYRYIYVNISHNEEIHLNLDICYINAGGEGSKIFYPIDNQFTGKVERMQMINLLTLVRIQTILPGFYMFSTNLIYYANENIT